MTEEKDPAFPYMEITERLSNGVTTKWKNYYGMSRRLYLAGMAMQGLLSKWNTDIATDSIVKRDPDTDRKISGTEAFKNQIKVMAKMALMATDELIKQEEETR